MKIRNGFYLSALALVTLTWNADPAHSMGMSKPKPKPTPAPVSRLLNMTVSPEYATATITPDDSTGPYHSTVKGHISVRVEAVTKTGWGANLHVEADGYKPYDGRIIIPAHDTELPAVTLGSAARRGVVHAEGSDFVDDDGAFYPLGGSLLWALHGWKYDQERVKQNLQYLKKFKFDYVRILGEVDWPTKKIDPRWGDYEQVLGEFLDYAYDVCGLRTEITLVGGTTDIDPMAFAAKVVNVVNAGRAHKVMNFEVANESYQRNITLDQMRKVGAYLKSSLPNLVSLSSGEGVATYSDNSDWKAGYRDVYLRSSSANMGTVHMDRDGGDLGWRRIRQTWDWKDFGVPISHNEPAGPRSSVAEETDLVRLAMMRATGIVNGSQGFVLHNGAGVTGEIDPAHNRPANLWEVPGIDDIMNAVRNVDSKLPARVGGAQHWNNGWPGCPMDADDFWGEGADHGVNRSYSVATGDGWITSVNGVKNYVIYTMNRRARIEVVDILQGKVQEMSVNPGDKVRLEPVSRDSNGFGAFLVIGHNQ
jgi:hypothetical protein